MATDAPERQQERGLTRCAVLGSPISHSRSPALHRAAYEALGLTAWRYDAFEVTEDSLQDFVGALTPQWRGLSLTMPLKQAVLPLLDEVAPQAALLRSVNTVVVDWSDGVARLSGDNTDVLGIETALRQLIGVSAPVRGCVVGGGATAASALAGLARLGAAEVTVLARRPEAARAALAGLGEPLGVRLEFGPLTAAPEVLPVIDVAVSTLPGGAADGVAQALSDSPAGSPGVLLDVVYHPWPTRLADQWQRRGGAVAGGAEMLLHQAAAQVEAMTGVAQAPTAAMRRALQP